MKALITGLNGTVGVALRDHLLGQGHAVVGWPRSQVAPWDDPAMEAFVRDQAPDVLFHLAIASKPTGKDNEGWLVNYEWPGKVAAICRDQGIPLVFTSTVMVFSNDARGPFTKRSIPDASEGYGYDKLRAEEYVKERNPDARVVRLGWQIGQSPGSNNMIDFFATHMAEHGQVQASTKWYPATSFLPDTAAVLVAILDKPAGLYMIDSNEAWTFYDIAYALNRLHGEPWTITPNQDFVYDQRMIDRDIEVPSLKTRLPDLP